MQCSFCLVDKDPVAPGPDVAICAECTEGAVAIDEIDDYCSFCGRRPGDRRGFLGISAAPRQQPAGRVTICRDCRIIARETLSRARVRR